MAATGYTPISLYYSTTAAAAPLNTSLVNGELAINITDGKLYYKDNGGVVQTIASKDANSGTFTNATVSGNLTLSSGTANGVLYLNGSKVATSGSALVFDGTNLGIGTGSPAVPLQINTGGITSSPYAAGRTADSPLFLVGVSSSSSGIRVNAQNYGSSSSSYLDLCNFESKDLGTASGYRLIGGVSSGTTTANNYLAFSSVTLNSNGTITATERLRIDSSGNVGIGTSSPATKLDVNGGSNKIFRALIDPLYKPADFSVLGGSLAVSRNADGRSDLYTFYGYTTSTGGENLAITSREGIVFLGNSIEYARFDSSGNLGLGVTPSAWNSSYRAFELANSGALINAGNTSGVQLVGNAFINSGSNWIYRNTAAASRYEQFTGGHYWYIAPSGTAGNAITFTQAMTLDASGNLGIGTTSPESGYRLDVRAAKGWAKIQSTTGTNETFLTINNTGSDMYIGREGSAGGAVATGTAAYSGVIAVGGAYPLAFATNLTERARITSGGDLLVGTTSAALDSSPGIKFTSNTGNANEPQVGVVTNRSTNLSIYHLYNTNATNNGYRWYVNIDGGVSNYSGNNVNLSDERMKTNIELSGNYLAKVCAIPVKLFNYKDEPEGEQKTLGVVAQDVEIVAPELVNTDGWQGNDPYDGVPLKTIYTTDMMYALMKAIQELKAELDATKAEVAALKGN